MPNISPLACVAYDLIQQHDRHFQEFWDKLFALSSNSNDIDELLEIYTKTVLYPLFHPLLREQNPLIRKKAADFTLDRVREGALTLFTAVLLGAEATDLIGREISKELDK